MTINKQEIKEQVRKARIKINYLRGSMSSDLKNERGKTVSSRLFLDRKKYYIKEIQDLFNEIKLLVKKEKIIFDKNKAVLRIKKMRVPETTDDITRQEKLSDERINKLLEEEHTLESLFGKSISYLLSADENSKHIKIVILAMFQEFSNILNIIDDNNNW